MNSATLLHDFNREVIQKSIDSTLPCNLADHWLRILANSLERILEGNPKDEDNIALDRQLVTMATQHIFTAKSIRLPDFKIPQPHIIGEYFESYRMELALESISRTTDIAVNAATLETIFTNREVSIDHKH